MHSLMSHKSQRSLGGFVSHLQIFYGRNDVRYVLPLLFQAVSTQHTKQSYTVLPSSTFLCKQTFNRSEDSGLDL